MTGYTESVYMAQIETLSYFG